MTTRKTFHDHAIVFTYSCRTTNMYEHTYVVGGRELEWEGSCNYRFGVILRCSSAKHG
jgi:hypothetical protein